MAVHQLNLAHENQLKPLKFQGHPHQKANGMSFWAFPLSIFIYISIFYIFNLSPSSLLNTTKFWFFITNTLILIIAADFGAFSSSKKGAEIYEEYVENSRGMSFPSFESQYQESVKTSIPPQKVQNLQETDKEEVKEVVEVLENKLQIVAKDDSKSYIEESQRNMLEFPSNVGDEAHDEEEKRETSIGNEPHEEENNKDEEESIGNRTETEEEDEGDEEQEEEEDDEFSTMSNEELNRRVEEFIQRCNRQIRLEAAQNRNHQMQNYVHHAVEV